MVQLLEPPKLPTTKDDKVICPNTRKPCEIATELRAAILLQFRRQTYLVLAAAIVGSAFGGELRDVLFRLLGG